MKRVKLILGLLAVCIASVSSVEGHAFLESAEPAVGSDVKESPAVVKLWFNRKLKRDGSQVEVFDAKGAEVDLKNVTFDRTDNFFMFVSVPKLPPGDYTVHWNATSLDSHRTSGKFTFHVGGP